MNHLGEYKPLFDFILFRDLQLLFSINKLLCKEVYKYKDYIENRYLIKTACGDSYNLLAEIISDNMIICYYYKSSENYMSYNSKNNRLINSCKFKGVSLKYEKNKQYFYKINDKDRYFSSHTYIKHWNDEINEWCNCWHIPFIIKISCNLFTDINELIIKKR